MVFQSRSTPKKDNPGHSNIPPSEDPTVQEKEQPRMAGAWSANDETASSMDLPHLQHQLGHEDGWPGIASSKRPSEAAQGLAADDAWHGNSGRWYQLWQILWFVTVKDGLRHLMMVNDGQWRFIFGG